MKHTVIINSEQTRQRALAIIQGLPLAPVCEVIVRERVKNRSLDSNALYWKWLTVIGNELGQDKESLHEFYKEKFLVNLYERDDPEYAAMIQSLREVYQKGMKTEALALRKRIVALTSTTTATVKQMSEYLHSIEMAAAELAIKLPFPEDRG